VSSRRYCPQCGGLVFDGSTGDRERLQGTVADAAGFCAPFERVRGDKTKSSGCGEHLVRFDCKTGARLEAPARSRSFEGADPWANASRLAP
jgi:hypothetical protein